MRVLILGGGGTLGAFSAGALLALERTPWKPDLCIGSSAGGINLLRSTVGGAASAVAFWRELDAATLLREALFDDMLNGGFLAERAFYERVERDVGFDALLADPRELSFLVADMETGRVALRGNRTEPTAERLRDVSRGAYALPPLMPPIRVDGRLLGDGGLLHNAPLERALRQGATEIVYLCNVQVMPFEGFARTSTFGASLRYLDIFVRRASNVGFADAEIIEGVYHGVPFVTIAPPPDRGLLSLVRAMIPTRRKLERLLVLGEAQAEKAIAMTPWITHPRDVRTPKNALPNRRTRLAGGSEAERGASEEGADR